MIEVLQPYEMVLDAKLVSVDFNDSTEPVHPLDRTLDTLTGVTRTADPIMDPAPNVLQLPAEVLRSSDPAFDTLLIAAGTEASTEVVRPQDLQFGYQMCASKAENPILVRQPCDLGLDTKPKSGDPNNAIAMIQLMDLAVNTLQYSEEVGQAPGTMVPAFQVSVGDNDLVKAVPPLDTTLDVLSVPGGADNVAKVVKSHNRSLYTSTLNDNAQIPIEFIRNQDQVYDAVIIAAAAGDLVEVRKILDLVLQNCRFDEDYAASKIISAERIGPGAIMVIPHQDCDNENAKL